MVAAVVVHWGQGSEDVGDSEIVESPQSEEKQGEPNLFLLNLRMIEILEICAMTPSVRTPLSVPQRRVNHEVHIVN